LKRSFYTGLLIAGALSVALLPGISCSRGNTSGSRRSGAQDTSRVAVRTRRARRSAADTVAGRARSAATAAAGKVARATGAKGKRGTLKATTQEDRLAERKKLRAQKQQLRRELRRKRQEERLARRAQRTRSSRRNKRGSLYDSYMLKATMAGQYAMIGTRRVGRGDVVAGKKIVEIGSDRIVVEQFGTTFTVRVGEPIDRSIQTKPSRR